MNHLWKPFKRAHKKKYHLLAIETGAFHTLCGIEIEGKPRLEIAGENRRDMCTCKVCKRMHDNK